MIEEYNIKLIQNKILTIFIEIDKICKKHDINYFAIGGTCIGAVRHKGFIPWDDDLDIAMPREDYEKFLSLADKELPANLRLFMPENIEHYECIFCKVQDINTTFIQRDILNYPDRYTGVYVDIMPLDGLPDNKFERKRHFDRLQIYGDLNLNRRRKSHEIHFGMKRFVWAAAKCIIDRFKVTAFFELYTRELKKYPFSTSNYTSYGWSERRNELVFPIEDFKDYVSVPFENYHMRCPIGYDNFLTIMFGEYMEFPPKEKQRPTHNAFVDLSRPVDFYIKNGIPEEVKQ